MLKAIERLSKPIRLFPPRWLPFICAFCYTSKQLVATSRCTSCHWPSKRRLNRLPLQLQLKDAADASIAKRDWNALAFRAEHAKFRRELPATVSFEDSQRLLRPPRDIAPQIYRSPQRRACPQVEYPRVERG